MAYYRLYFFNGKHIDRFHEYEAVDDLAARTVAEGLHGARHMELWSGARKIRRWDGLKSN